MASLSRQDIALVLKVATELRRKLSSINGRRRSFERTAVGS